MSTNLVEEIDQIAPFLELYQTSLAPGSIRLMKIDVGAFLRWHSYQSTNLEFRKALPMTLIVEEYLSSITNNTSKGGIDRKRSNILKFMHWQNQNHSNQNNSEASLVISTKITKSKVLSYKLFLLLLSTIFGMYLIYVGVYNPKNSRTDIVFTKSPIRFVIYMPVVSLKTDSTSLKLGLSTLNVYNSYFAGDLMMILSCQMAVANSSKNPVVILDSERDCSLKYINEPLTKNFPNPIFADIFWDFGKINGNRLSIKPATQSPDTVGQLQGQDDLSNNTSNQFTDLLDLIDPAISSASSQLEIPTTRPKNPSFPISLFDTLDLESGDILTISGNTLTKALLNNPVYGVLNGDNLITSGKAIVSVSFESQSIVAGDGISASLTPGLVIKASKGYENVIGYALESWNRDKQKIEIILNID